MGKPNAHKLPEHLRRGAGGFFLDYEVFENGRKRRVREKLGQIPLTLAKSIRDKRMAELATGEYLVKARPRAGFRQAAEAFLAYSKSRKRSWLKDEQMTRELVRHFGDRPLDSLNLDVVEKFLNQIRACGPSGKRLVEGSLNRYLACLKTLVNRALANGLIERNPIRGLKLFKENNQRDRVLSHTEYQSLLEACARHLKPIVMLAYTIGMRRGEILGLRWDQVDLKEGVISLEAADTKTNEKREVPLDQGLIELLKGLRFAPGGQGFVFTFRRKPVKDVKTAFLQACRDAGIEDFRFHDLRHCAVTNLRKAGVDTATIMSITGHKTEHMFRRYNKVDRQDRQEALRRVRLFYDTAQNEGHQAA